MPTLVSAAERLCAGQPERRVVCVTAGSVEEDIRAAAKSWTFPHILIGESKDKANAFAAMEVALASSGTVTTELGAQGAAVVSGYKLGWMTWAILRAFLFRSPYTTLMNVAADREIAPEFTQTTFTAQNLARAAERLLSDPAALAEQREGQRQALAKMAGPDRPAAEIAAETILKLA
jgi:lipid-A-disaccharide synthase